MNRSTMGNILKKRLLAITRLSIEESRALQALEGRHHHVPAGAIIIEQCRPVAGRPVVGMVQLQDGWAIRYRDLENGRRQIMDFLLPGDFCNPCSLVAEQCDFSVAAITPLTYSVISQSQLLDLVQRIPRIALLLWWEEAAEADRLRSHLAAVGRMSAYERVAQLLIELWSRVKMIERSADYSFVCPITQEMIADATGLSTIHVNRVLRKLERDTLIERKGKVYTFIDPERLQHIARTPAGPQPGHVLRSCTR